MQRHELMLMVSLHVGRVYQACVKFFWADRTADMRRCLRWIWRDKTYRAYSE